MLTYTYFYIKFYNNFNYYKLIFFIIIQKFIKKKTFLSLEVYIYFYF